ncbi:MAG: hypothetical protein ACJ71Q_01460 [Terriglobales bacterium]
MPLPNESRDLVSVHSLYVAILEAGLGYQVPLPPEVIQAQTGSEPTREVAFALLRWLGMLDLAISPPMVRDQLYATKDNESADALLRYYVKKASVSDLDRDKADCVLGFLFRHSGEGATTQLSNEARYYTAAVSTFKTEIDRVLSGFEHRDLAPEHAQLLREYDFFYQELNDFRTFDQLMDCGILGRMHNLKKSFGNSFYHPEVLSAAGVFNGVFGKRFDELFLEATQQIKSFAARVQQEGTSIMSRVDGEVRVQQLAELKDEQILDKEYGRAREDFEKISSFKKAVDKRRINSHSSVQAGSISERLSSNSGSAVAPLGIHSAQQVTDAFVATHAIAEETKFRQAGDQIRMFVRAADPKVCFTVPLPKRNLVLTSAEADAFRSDYGREESFRAQYAEALVKLVTAKVRVTNELLDFQEKQNFAYLWKAHADSLMYLMKLFDKLQELANEVIAAAGQRGLMEKANAITTARNNLHAALQSASQSLQSLAAPGR